MTAILDNCLVAPPKAGQGTPCECHWLPGSSSHMSMTGFQPNTQINDGSWLIPYPAHAEEKGALKAGPPIYANPINSSAQSTRGAHCTFSYTPQHKHKLIVLYQGKAPELNICLKADIIMHQSEPVDEYLPQLILALP